MPCCLLPIPHLLRIPFARAQDAWRGRQSAATTLAHMDSFFKTVLTSSMGNDLQVGGLYRGGRAGHLPSHAAGGTPTTLLSTLHPSSTPLQNKDLALPQHSDRAHKLLADNETTVHMSYDVRARACGLQAALLAGAAARATAPLVYTAASLNALPLPASHRCRSTDHAA